MIRKTILEAKTISESFYRLVAAALDNGRRSVVQHGSTGCVDKIRCQFDYALVHIEYPDPSTALPDVLSSFGLPNPVSFDYWETNYKRYIMTAEMQPNETYTYGSRMWAGPGLIFPIDQITHWQTVLFETPDTNQAVIQIAQPSDSLLPDPPCLRQIKLRILDGKLHFFINFRSWDLWGGYPANLQGLAHLQHFMAANLGIEPGEFVCESAGLHLYMEAGMEEKIYSVVSKMFREGV